MELTRFFLKVRAARSRPGDQREGISGNCEDCFVAYILASAAVFDGATLKGNPRLVKSLPAPNFSCDLHTVYG